MDYTIVQFSWDHEGEVVTSMSLHESEEDAYNYIRTHMASNIKGVLIEEAITQIGSLLMQPPTDEVMEKLIELWESHQFETIKVHYERFAPALRGNMSPILCREGFKDLLSEFPYAEVPDEVIETFKTDGFGVARVQMKQIAAQWEEAEEAESEARFEVLRKRVAEAGGLDAALGLKRN